MKKLKCIPCSLKLDISPCVEEVKCCLNPDLVKLNPYPGKLYNISLNTYIYLFSKFANIFIKFI